MFKKARKKNILLVMETTNNWPGGGIYTCKKLLESNNVKEFLG